MVKTKLRFAVLLAAAFLVSLSPVFFNFVVDPFNHNGLVDLDLGKSEISVKAHYPLYKMIEYPKRPASIVVLGDSRARALQDRYWQELEQHDAYNFAYGGATVTEIYETFAYLRQRGGIKTLIVGLPLRSMDARFKNGMNRVPEAIALAENPLAYYSNWFVAKTGWSLLEDRYPAWFRTPADYIPSLVSAAEANELGEVGTLSVETLLDPTLCGACLPPVQNQVTAVPVRYHGFGHGLGYWSSLWPEISLDRTLPAAFAKQVGVNGGADWRRFQQSEELWAKVEEMADWCARNGVQLIFVIPPTISEMQQRIADFGFAHANLAFRARLSAMATVVDFDYDNAFTRELENFTDAYHFSSGPARQIVGELLQIVDSDQDRIRAARTRRGSIVCPVVPSDVSSTRKDEALIMEQGSACRIWRTDNG